MENENKVMAIALLEKQQILENTGFFSMDL